MRCSSVFAAAAVCAAAALPLHASAALSSLSSLHGISPALQRTLAVATSFTCDGGAKRFDLARINDNYCDCDDGSDEPGTSACSHTPAVFHCANAGFYAQDIPTSRVNDQICDCCDGSDEYASGAQCPVTCAALMKTFQADKAVEIASMEAGEADRKVLVADAAAAYAADQDKRAALASSVASLRVMLEQQEARKAHEEELERADRVSRLREKQATLLQQLGLADLSHEQLSLIVLELSKHLDSPDELLALIARERASVSAAQATPLPPSPIEEQEAAFRVRDEARQRETERIQALLDERRAARDAAAAATSDDVPGVGGSESTTSDSESSSSESTGDSDLVLPEIEERPAKLLFQELHAHNDYERPEAAEARATLADTTQSLGTHETDLRVLDAKLAKAYGPDRVLYALRDQCYETQSGEYTYSVCVFGDAKQSNTRLGAMQDINDDDALTTLTFSGGDKCWNGPERSIQVALECGALPVELYAVDEPATCVYTAKLRTPLACDQRNRDRVLSPASGEAPVAPHHVEVEVSATL